MAKVLISESILTAIADAIREKLSTTDTYKPSEMADAVESISGGGGGGADNMYDYMNGLWDGSISPPT